MNIVRAIITELTALGTHLCVHYPPTRVGFLLREFLYRKKLRGKLGKNPILAPSVIICTQAPIEIGDDFSAGRNVTIDPNDSFGILIGNGVGIAENTFVRAANHDYSQIDVPFKMQGHITRKIQDANGRDASIIIEDDVWIGANCVILSGAHIHRGAIIAAGSVVASPLPEYSISVGNPARVFANRKLVSFSKKYHRMP